MGKDECRWDCGANYLIPDYVQLHYATLLYLRVKRWFFSSAEAFLCSREAVEKEKESARGTMGRGKTAPAFSLFPSYPARFLFFRLLLFLLGYPAGASAEERTGG